MRTSISNLNYNWRECGLNIFGGYDYIEIDVHNNNFHKAKFYKVMYYKDGTPYIRRGGVSYTLE